MKLPEEGVTSGVDSPESHTRVVAMVEVVWIFEKVRWVKLWCYWRAHDDLWWIDIELSFAVIAQAVLSDDVGFSCCSSLTPVCFFVVDW